MFLIWWLSPPKAPRGSFLTSWELCSLVSPAACLGLFKGSAVLQHLSLGAFLPSSHSEKQVASEIFKKKKNHHRLISFPSLCEEVCPPRLGTRGARKSVAATFSMLLSASAKAASRKATVVLLVPAVFSSARADVGGDVKCADSACLRGLYACLGLVLCLPCTDAALKS